MTDEFCLSDKRERDYADMTEDFYLYSEENVKEFIRKLKEDLCDDEHSPTFIINRIDKLAGEKLV